MLSRRELMAAGFAGGGLGGATGTPAAAELEQQADRDGQREIARAIANVDTSLRNALLSNTLSHGFVGKIRGQMEVFFRGAAKFPDFIEVGLSVFMDVYDWHVKHRQQLVVTRGADGRYWMQFMFTTLVLRAEVDPAFVGIPYDKA